MSIESTTIFHFSLRKVLELVKFVKQSYLFIAFEFISIIKGALPGLRQFLAIKNAL